MSDAVSYFGVPVIEHPHMPEGQAMFSTSHGRERITNAVFTESALQEAIARLKRDNPENPRYMVINPKQMAMLKNLRWNEPETPETMGTKMFRLLEQEEQKWQDLFARQHI